MKKEQKSNSKTLVSLLDMVSWQDITAVLITKESEYPREILTELEKIPFKEILIKTSCTGVFERYELAKKAKTKYVYVQDDDCIAPTEELLKNLEEDTIVCAMKPYHLAYYGESKICLIGWGAIFPWYFLFSFHKYLQKFNKDRLWEMETDRIFTFLNYPQIRLELPIKDLDTFEKKDRLSLRENHFLDLKEIETRLKTL